MSDLSSRVSLREIVGGVAPGLMVIASFIYVAARIPTLEVGWNAFGYGMECVACHLRAGVRRRDDAQVRD